MSVRLWVIALLVLACEGCEFGSQPLSPLVVGSQQFFTIEWRSVRRGNQPVVQGYIRNNWGFPASGVRLLVEGVDPGDRLIAQRLTTIGGQLLPGTQATFETAMPPAAAYRVRMFSYEWVQSGEMFGR